MPRNYSFDEPIAYQDGVQIFRNAEFEPLPTAEIVGQQARIGFEAHSVEARGKDGGESDSSSQNDDVRQIEWWWVLGGFAEAVATRPKEEDAD